MDVVGLLAIGSRPSFPREDSDLTQQDFSDFTTNFEGRRMSTQDINDRLRLLDLGYYRSVLKPKGGAQVDPLLSYIVLPPILRLLQITRIMATEINVGNKTIRIRDSLKPYRLTTIEVGMDSRTSKAQFDVHCSCAE